MSTKGKQRLSTVNVGTMNPLNEEDESTLANTVDEPTDETEVDSSANMTSDPTAEAFDKRQEQTKLRYAVLYLTLSSVTLSVKFVPANLLHYHMKGTILTVFSNPYRLVTKS